MKNTNIIKIIVFCLLVSLTCSCSKPRIDWNSINWEIWNDVATISAAFSDKSCQDEGNTGRTIKVYGWIPKYAQKYAHGGFSLEESLEANKPNIYIEIEDSITGNLRQKFDTCDMSKKCYIRGELQIIALHNQLSCSTGACVYVSNTADIWFE